MVGAENGVVKTQSVARACSSFLERHATARVHPPTNLCHSCCHALRRSLGLRRLLPPKSFECDVSSRLCWCRTSAPSSSCYYRSGKCDPQGRELRVASLQAAQAVRRSKQWTSLWPN